MTNPFEDENGSYFVLCNEEGQHSLWPDFADVPEGWTKRFGPESRSTCLAFVEKKLDGYASCEPRESDGG
jgi:MbtH protein